MEVMLKALCQSGKQVTSFTSFNDLNQFAKPRSSLSSTTSSGATSSIARDSFPACKSQRWRRCAGDQPIGTRWLSSYFLLVSTHILQGNFMFTWCPRPTKSASSLKILKAESPMNRYEPRARCDLSDPGALLYSALRLVPPYLTLTKHRSLCKSCKLFKCVPTSSWS